MAFFKNLRDKLFKKQSNAHRQQVPDIPLSDPDPVAADEAPQHRVNSPFDLIRFHSAELEYFREDEQVRQWRTEDGDMLELYYESQSPEIDADTGSLDSLQRFYQQQFSNADGAVVEVDLLDRGRGWQAILAIGQLPQSPSGTTYTGTITVPFRDFSYVLKMICREHDPVGIREQAEMAEQYDEQFPNHPLTRLRRMMTTLSRSLELDDLLLENVPFTGQSSSSAPKSSGDGQQNRGEDEASGTIAAEPVIGGIYAVQDDPDEPYWLVKVIFLQDRIVHTVRYSLCLDQVPPESASDQKIDENILTTGLDSNSGSFGIEHLPLPVSVLQRYGVFLQQTEVSQADCRGYELFIDCMYECLAEESPQWLKKAISLAAWRYSDRAMTVLVDRYLIGVDLIRDSRKALYWLNRLVDRERRMVAAGTMVREEDQVVTGGIYACLTENNSYGVSRVMLRNRETVQQLLFPVEFDHLPVELNPVQLLAEILRQSDNSSTADLFHAEVSVAEFMEGEEVCLGILPVTVSEIHCYRAYLRELYGGERFQESAFEILEQQAGAGDAQAQFEVGRCYLNDNPAWEIRRNPVLAHAWLTMAVRADNGLPEADKQEAASYQKTLELELPPEQLLEAGRCFRVLQGNMSLEPDRSSNR